MPAISDSFHIFPLAQCLADINTLAHWHQSEWQRMGLVTDFAKRKRNLLRHLYGRPLPVTFVAKIYGRPVGCASLLSFQQHVSARPVYWLANVFVDRPYRNLQVGTRLIKHIQSYASQQTFKRLHLFTTDQKAFYLRKGWQWYGCSKWHKQSVDVMYYDVTL